MKKMDLIICGLGGQGILFMTKIISLTVIEKGYNVLAAETHGMAQRGGSVISHLRLGNPSCSLINNGTADVIISLDEHEVYRNLSFLKKGGKVYTNIAEEVMPYNEVKHYFREQKIDYNGIEASKIIQKFSAPLSLNLAVLGYFLSFDNELFNKNEVRTIIREVSPLKFIDKNLEIFDVCSDKKYN